MSRSTPSAWSRVPRTLRVRYCSAVTLRPRVGVVVSREPAPHPHRECDRTYEEGDHRGSNEQRPVFVMGVLARERVDDEAEDEGPDRDDDNGGASPPLTSVGGVSHGSCFLAVEVEPVYRERAHGKRDREEQR